MTEPFFNMHEGGEYIPPRRRFRNAIAVGVSAAALVVPTGYVAYELSHLLLSTTEVGVSSSCTHSKIVYRSEIPQGSAAITIKEKTNTITDKSLGQLCVGVVSNEGVTTKRYMGITVEQDGIPYATDESDEYRKFAGWIILEPGGYDITGTVLPVDAVNNGGRVSEAFSLQYYTTANRAGEIAYSQVHIAD